MNESYFYTLNGCTAKGTNYCYSIEQETDYVLYHNGDGADTLNIWLKNGEWLFVKNWQAGNLGINGTTPKGETLYGGSGNDLISGSVADDYISGDQDDDLLYGNAGHDHMFGGSRVKHRGIHHD